MYVSGVYTPTPFNEWLGWSWSCLLYTRMLSYYCVIDMIMNYLWVLCSQHWHWMHACDPFFPLFFLTHLIYMYSWCPREIFCWTRIFRSCSYTISSSFSLYLFNLDPSFFLILIIVLSSSVAWNNQLFKLITNIILYYYVI